MNQGPDFRHFVAFVAVADPPPTLPPAPEAETEQEAEVREAEYELRKAEYDAEQKRKEEERKQEFERQQQEYETEQTRRRELRGARQASFERILANAPAIFSAAQLRLFLSALVNLDPYDFAEDVAAFYVGDNENNEQTAEEVLSCALATLPDENLTEFALRLVLTGHTDIPRESDIDFLAQAEVAFIPLQPKKTQGKKQKPQSSKRRRRRHHPKRKLRLKPNGEPTSAPQNFCRRLSPSCTFPFKVCGANLT